MEGGQSELLKNPKRVIAGRANRRRRGPLTEAGRQRLREAALLHKPWKHATGPRTAAGRAQAALNGKRRQRGPQSVREVRAALAPVRKLLEQMRETRQQLSKLQGDS
jgi:hypothetical protein